MKSGEQTIDWCLTIVHKCCHVFSGVPSVVLIFNHLAPHMSRIRTATKDRLSDRQLVNSSTDILDVVFWNGHMYSCDANTKAISQLREQLGINQY